MSGLFGKSSGGGGLFGGQSKPTGGGLFGGQSKPTGGGLFGGQSTSGGGGGLFGGSSTSGGSGFGSSTSTGGGGLFGGQSKPTGGGLFGSSSTSTSGGGMMGSSTGTGGGGLFGSKTTTSGGGGLFGSKPQTTGTSSFGGGSSGGGLFGRSGGGMGTQGKSTFFGGGSSFGGASSSGFGSSGGGGSGFGSSGSAFGGGSQQANLAEGTINVHFTEYKDKDHGSDNKSSISLHSLTAQPAFNSLSLEELRAADYLLKKQGKANFPIGAQPAQKSAGTPSFGGSSSGGGGLFGGGSKSSNPFGGSTTQTTGGTSTGGLFGASKTSIGFGSKPSGGGLFGSSTTSSTTTSGFGASKPSTGGGLFGSSSSSGFGQKPAGTTGGGLFGSTASKPAGTGLFGGGGASTTAKPALFGQSSGGAKTGLFGSSTGTSGFGAKTTTGFGSNTAKPGLFGSSSGTTSGGLFNKPSGFGSSTTGTTGSAFGTSFGSSAPQQTAQPPVDQQYAEIFASLNQDPYGTKGLEETLKLHSVDADKQAILSKIVEQVISYKDQQKSSKTTISSSRFEENEFFNSSSADAPISLKFSNKSKIHFTGSFKSQENPYLSSKSNSQSKRKDYEATSRQMEYERAKNEQDYLREASKFISKATKKDNVQTRVPEVRSFETSKEPIIRKNINETQLSGPNSVNVKVNVFIEDRETQILVTIHKSRTIKELIELCTQKIGFTSEADLMKIVHKSRILNESNTVEESDIQNNMALDLLIQEKQTPGGPGHTQTATGEGKTRDYVSFGNEKFTEKEKLPIQKNISYTLIPDLIEMARMTEYELMNIKDLTIENQYGRITWVGRTDAREINFDQLVEIAPFAATVYPPEIEAKNLKPPVGNGLNKPAIISLFNIKQPRNDKKTPEAFENNLRERTATMEDCEFIKYEKDEGILTFRVEHFTRYDFAPINNQNSQSESEEERAEETKEVMEPSSMEVGTGRFSFGQNQPVRRTFRHTEEQKDIDVDVEEEEEDSRMSEEESERERHRSYRNADNFLHDINEESESRSSKIEIEPKQQTSSKKESKINFGYIYEKKFEEQKPEEDLEYEQEEEEEEYQEDEQCFLSTDDIRNKIKQRKLEIQKSMENFSKKRVVERERINPGNLVKTSTNSGAHNKLLYMKKLKAVNAVLGVAQMKYYYDEEEDTERGNNPEKDRKARNCHYENILQNHMKFSKIYGKYQKESLESRFNSLDIRPGGRPAAKAQAYGDLPIIDPPTEPCEFTDMWYEILRSSRELLAPSNILSEYLKIDIEKDCETFTLLNALFGNAFIDLSRYMGNPGYLNRTKMDKYRSLKVKEANIEKARNNLMSNWLKYVTNKEVETRLNSENLTSSERAGLSLYTGDKISASENLINTSKESEGVYNNSSLNEDNKGLQENYHCNNTVSWKCNLAKFFWEHCDCDITKAYNHLLNVAADNDHEEDGSSKNLVLEKDDPLMCEILGVYCNLDRVDYSIFRERGIDIQNSCVRRTMWSLITCLKKLNAFLIREEQIAGIDVDSRTRFSEIIESIYPRITFEYAHELETLGLWKWAIFVILHLDNSSQKSKYIRDILLKYAGEEQDLTFLRDNLKIPEYYMHEAKATYYQAKGEYAEAFSHWLECESSVKNPSMARYEVGENNRIDLRRLSSSNLSFYKKAHDLLMTQVIISSESLPQKFSDLQLMIEKLEKNKEYISNWENNGRILYEFLRLRADSIGYLSTFFDNYGEYAPVEEQWKNSNTQEEITKLQARLSALVKSFENFCQFEVSQNMTSMKTELKRILLDWDTKFKIINAKLNDNHINLSFPNDLLLDSQDLNICDKKNALDKCVNVSLSEYLSAK